MNIATTTEASAAAAAARPTEALVKFCLLWSVLHTKPSPSACKNAMKNQDPSQRMIFTNKDFLATLDGINKYDLNSQTGSTTARDKQRNFTLDYRHSSRSLSVIGVLGGIVLILFFVALSTCIKHRRNLYVTDRYPIRDNFAREILADHIRQLRSAAQRSHSLARDRPPSYEDVVKDPPDGEDGEIELAEEAQPPSYLEATTVARATASSTPDEQEENTAFTTEAVEAIEIADNATNHNASVIGCDREAVASIHSQIASEDEESVGQRHTESHTVTIEVRP